jgi:hypothetical protein
MDQTIAAEILRTSPLFDADWYRRAYPDVALLDMDPALHYVRYGAPLGRDPGPAFNTRFYLVATPGLAGTQVNPLLHFLAGAPEGAGPPGHPPGDPGRPPQPAEPLLPRAGGPSPAELVRPHFDSDFYREQGAEVPDGADPVAHFLAEGWRLGLAPNRWFDPLGYAVLHKHVARRGLNPFLHFLRHGLAAGSTPNPYSRDRYLRRPDLERLGAAEYGPIAHVLRHAAGPEPAAAPGRLCVQVHAFDTGMLGAVRSLLARIPPPFTLLVSIPEGRDAGAAGGFLAAGLDPDVRVVVRAVPDRGRDVAPWLVHFRDEVRGSELFCHFHTKPSAPADDHRYWFRFLCHTMLGSREVVAQILDLFRRDPGLGLLAPAYFPMLRRQPDFGQAKPEFDRLLARIGAAGRYDFCPDYPAGSFFWCRTAILAPLLEADLTLRDFPEAREPIGPPLDQGVERLLGALAAEAGLRTDLVAVDQGHEVAEHRPLDLAFRPEELLSAPELAVSVIVPTWNRRPSLLRALESAFAQTRAPQQVIVVDDGSTDGSLRAVRRRFRAEVAQGRLKLIAARHRGVSAARNAGLAAATGEVIAYLDSDNTWRPDYLAHVVTAFARHPNALSAYADFLRHDADRDCSELYGRSYDRGALLERNFIDLNVFSHRREILARGHRFDPGLRRLVDWDFILGATFHRAPLHLVHIGADYHLDKAGLGNITHTVPLRQPLTQVQRKHRRERVFHRLEPLSFAIKCPAPMRNAARGWGDLYFASSLCAALERLGCRTRIDLLEAWEREKGADDDVVLVLRGLSRYRPRPEHINLMWHISHPDRVDVEEMRAYDHVFVASYRETRALHGALGTKVSVLLQCADPEVFHPGPLPPGAPAHELLFVGNSRRVDRWMPMTCAARGLPITVYGQDWEDRLPEAAIGGRHVPNGRLGAYYRAAKVVLNDHWPDMARRGFVSNRIFDAGLCGALVVSDRFEGAEIFFGSVVTCSNAAELETELGFFLGNEPARRMLAERLRRIVLGQHTFDHRARELVHVARRIAALRLGLPTAVAAANEDLPATPWLPDAGRGPQPRGRLLRGGRRAGMRPDGPGPT